MPDPKTTAEDVRNAAQAVAQALHEGVIGGECYHGGINTCFVRQGRRPIALYKNEELCERCALSWHAVMTAMLLDSVLNGQRFMNSRETASSKALLICSKCGRDFRGTHERTCKGR